MNSLISVAVIVAGLLFFYHHFLYPKLLAMLAKHQHVAPDMESDCKIPADGQAPEFITVIIPCFNEQHYIAEKLFNFAFVDYPKDRFKVIVANDGSTDQTVEVYQRTIQHPLLQDVQFELRDFAVNRGKIAVLNQLLQETPVGLVCLSDVSALISVDAFQLMQRHMQDTRIGAVAASYCLLNPGSDGEAAYWRYQTAIKQHESAMGSTLGVHGALYCIRAELFMPLAPDSINDDFIIPMQIIEQGYRVIYDPTIIGVELERSTQCLDFKRRIRIAAGNVQQVIKLRQILHPRFGATAFNFFSGKFLRVLMPLCMVVMLLGSGYLAKDHLFWSLILGGQLCGYSLAALVHYWPNYAWPKPLRLIHYLVVGHSASLAGWLMLIRRSPRVLAWRKTAPAAAIAESYLPPTTQWAKRIFDVSIASIVFVATLPLWVLIAMAIRIESKGPVFFRQLRIGLSTSQQTNLFYMIKFRSMVQDAERDTGAVWATVGDSRVTRVGRFLRNTRLDELPQMLNVIRGDMSLVGPRPERPELCGKLDEAIPFFAERTFFVRPGITGLAQINSGYDSCLDDVKRKVLYDHSYALALHTPTSWLKMDLQVIAKTFLIMVLGRGR